jgi:hypothetical protein
MTIDVQLTYEDGRITATSNTAKYHETRPAVLALSIKAGEKEEKIEAIGEPRFDPRLSASAPPCHTYRFLDPLAKETFDADCAFVVVKHFCYVAHAHIKPPRSLLRNLVRLDRFEVSIKLAHYSQITEEKRKRFAKLLSERFGKVRIEEYAQR